MAIVGIPFEALGKLYNCAAIITNGKVMGLVPKKNLPNYSEFYEARHFTPGFKDALKVTFPGQNEEVLMGMNIIFKDKKMSSFTFSLIQQYDQNVFIVYLIPDTVLDQDVYQ